MTVKPMRRRAFAGVREWRARDALGVALAALLVGSGSFARRTQAAPISRSRARTLAAHQRRPLRSILSYADGDRRSSQLLTGAIERRPRAQPPPTTTTDGPGIHAGSRRSRRPRVANPTSVRSGSATPSSSSTRATLPPQPLPPTPCPTPSTPRSSTGWSRPAATPVVPSTRIADVWRRLSDWPGQTLLQTRYEQALVREKPPAATVIKALGDRTLVTESGTMLLARAYLDVGKKREAAAVIGAYWRTERFDSDFEARLRKEFGALISGADYKTRLDRLLYEEQTRRRSATPSISTATRSRSPTPSSPSTPARTLPARSTRFRPPSARTRSIPTRACATSAARTR